MANYVFGIDVGGTSVKCGLFQTDGTLLEKWEIPTRTENGGSEILPDIAKSVKAKMAEKGIAADDVAGVGIDVPGPVNDKGELSIAVNLNWGYKNIVKELSDEENMLLAIIENMQREDLNPIEEAEGLNQMIETYGLTQEQVSKSVGKSRPYITNCLRLLRLAEAVKNYISDGSLSMGHAKAIAAVTDEKKQIMLAENAVKNGLSVRQTEKLAKENKSKQTRSVKKKKDADVKKVEEDLKDVLGTKVVLNHKGKKGKIEIEYYSKEELERLIELLRNLKN